MADQIQILACPRCNGSGVVRPWGTCFRCRGDGKVRHNASAAKRRETTEANRRTKMDNQYNAWMDANPELAERIEEFLKGRGNSFVSDILGKIRQYGSISENQKNALVNCLDRQEKYATERMEREARQAHSAHQGVVGEKWTGQLTVVFTTEFTTQYGVSHIYVFEDGAGNTFKWMSTNRHEIKRGDRVTLTGKVKKHDEYKGCKQTIVTRCKITVEAAVTASAPDMTDELEMSA